MHSIVLEACSYSCEKNFCPLCVIIVADVGQGRGVDRKHDDILLPVGSVMSLTFLINEKEAAERDWPCLCVTSLAI